MEVLKILYLPDGRRFESGPHLYVRGSQQTAASLFARPIGHDYIERTFGLDSICPITGPAGTAFMVDVNGIYAGPIPIQRPRLMLKVGYSILPVFAMLYEPMAIEPRPAVDKYINRLFVKGCPVSFRRFLVLSVAPFRRWGQLRKLSA